MIFINFKLNSAIHAKTYFFHFCEILQFSCLILFKQNFFGVLLYVQAPDEPKVEKLGTVDFPINPCKTGQLL